MGLGKRMQVNGFFSYLKNVCHLAGVGSIFYAAIFSLRDIWRRNVRRGENKTRAKLGNEASHDFRKPSVGSGSLFDCRLV